MNRNIDQNRLQYGIRLCVLSFCSFQQMYLYTSEIYKHKKIWLFCNHISYHRSQHSYINNITWGTPFSKQRNFIHTNLYCSISNLLIQCLWEYLLYIVLKLRLCYVGCFQWFFFSSMFFKQQKTQKNWWNCREKRQQQLMPIEFQWCLWLMKWKDNWKW